MATYTDNYNLEKPAQTDLYNIDVFNENADKIDEALGDKAENQSLAPIESSATASRNYSVGQQFVYNGLLYEATAAIASGGTITPGTNCARTTVAEELSALNDSLADLAKRFVRVLGSNTYKTGESTFDFSDAPINRKPWLIVGNGYTVTLTFTSATTPVLGGPQASSITATSVGNYKVKLSGITWYDNPFAISFSTGN